MTDTLFEMNDKGDVLFLHADMREALKALPENSVDSVVTDPPYHLQSIVKRFGAENAAPAQFGKDGAFARASKGFLGKAWDGGDIAFNVNTWREVMRVMKPGGYIVSFSGSRTYGRMQVALEDAGFITHPMIGWVTAQGFPKGTKVDDPAWQGWRYGTQSLKPALEPIYMGQKPFSEKTGTANILRWGTGAVNVDECRVEAEPDRPWRQPSGLGVSLSGSVDGSLRNKIEDRSHLGRWPANLVHDGSDEVVALFPNTAPSRSGKPRSGKSGDGWGMTATGAEYDDSGSAARFFFSAKANAKDRIVRVIEEVLIEWNSESAEYRVVLQGDTEQLPEKVTVASESTAELGWSTFLCGSTIKEIFRSATKCTISTGTNLTIESRIWNLLMTLRTNASTEDANCVAGSGGNLAENVGVGIRQVTITLGKTVFLPGAVPVVSGTLLRISVGVKKHSHPTCKPISLMRWLTRLITPPGGLVLDPFAGSGTTGAAALEEGMRCLLIEREAEYADDIRRRLSISDIGLI